MDILGNVSGQFVVEEKFKIVFSILQRFLFVFRWFNLAPLAFLPLSFIELFCNYDLTWAATCRNEMSGLVRVNVGDVLPVLKVVDAAAFELKKKKVNCETAKL